jgi:hypothetical protein
MDDKLDIRNGSGGFIQPQLMDDAVYQGEHEADQEYVGMGD